MKELRFALLLSSMLVILVCSATSFYADVGEESEQSVIKLQKVELPVDVVVERPCTGFITIISAADAPDGYMPLVDPRCNGPTSLA